MSVLRISLLNKPSLTHRITHCPQRFRLLPNRHSIRFSSSIPPKDNPQKQQNWETAARLLAKQMFPDADEERLKDFVQSIDSLAATKNLLKKKEILSHLEDDEIYTKALGLKDRLQIYSPPPLFDESVAKKKLGPFFKKALPMTNKVFDMRFAELPKDAPDTLEDLELDPSTEMHRILVGNSGCGKTRTIFDVGRKYFTVFFECGLMEDEDKLNPGTDRAFMKFFDDVKSKVDELVLVEFRKYVKQRIALEVTSRLLYLRLLFDTKPDLTPEEYLVSQLNGAQQTIATIIGLLSNETYENLDTLQRVVVENMAKDILKNQGKIIFALDEINVGYQVLREKGIWKSPRSKSNRGVLTPFIQYISTRSYGACTIYAGTSLSMSISDTIQSDIGKPTHTKIVKDFPHLTLEDVSKRLNLWLQLDGIELTSSTHFKYTQGRGRFSSIIPFHIRYKQSSSIKKQSLWNDALSANFELIKNKLANRLQSSLQQKTNKDAYFQKIEKLYIGAKLANGSVQVGPDEELVNIGLASLTEGRRRDYCTVKEPLAMETLVEVFEKEHLTFGQMLSKLLDESINSNVKGYHFQIVCACLIKSFTESYSGLTIYDFIDKLYNGNQNLDNLPPWTKKASFTTIQSIGNYEELGFYDNNAAISHMFLEGNCGLLLQPGNVTRPDLLSLNSLDGSEYWGFLCSIKLKTKPLGGKEVTYDKNSTEIVLDER
eukprot:TRINITY_DN3540_c0_g1_i10.p1 TRINITY_DN3540_c0_g1~~TRINITY_DN3540_c0_g1_i10.p1  ORF type:complete len:714 (-),score=101.30 TRINITY_DN3540_c0_g1_i10:2188-4329(-)